MAPDSKTWQAPGPGLWEMDESHQSAPYSTYMRELIKAHFNTGVREGAARYGLLIDRFDIRFIDGWQFVRMLMVGAPEKPGPLPPRWLFKLLFRLHPALRRRAAAASRAVVSQPWRQDAEWWMHEGRDRFRARLAGLQSVDLAALSDPELRSHIAEVRSATAEGMRIHFRDALAHWIGVGDWLMKTSEWTGTAPDVAVAALQGASPFSVDAVEYLNRVAAAASESPAALEALSATGDAAGRLAAMRAASPGVAAALDAYLDEHGWRIYTGFDIADKAAVELPENIVDAVAARLRPANDSSPVESFAVTLRSSVPAANLQDYDRLLETARILYGVRDDDAGPCVHWTLGLVRRALLESGRRLAERGALLQPEHVFDATPEEVDGLLGGTPPMVAADEVARRAEARLANAAHRPPSRLGEEEGPPPPDDWLPPAVARVNGALMVAMSIEYPAAVDSPPEEEAKTILKGNAASRGQYEGRACVVHGPDDFAKLQPGDVLVAPFTTTAYGVVLPLLGGVVTERGGVLSHAAIVAREYAIPAVVNTAHATSLIADGVRVRVDGDSGTIEVLEAPGLTGGHPRGERDAVPR